MPAVPSITIETRQVRSGNSQAIRLPAKIAYPPDTRLTLTKIGDKLIIEPAGESMEGFIDFMRTVGKLHDGQRVDLDIPDRGW